LIVLIAAYLCAIITASVIAQDTSVDRSKTAVVLEIRDAIGPATSDFFMRTLEAARERNLALVILELDTPGGLDSAMRDMIRAILASDVPVVTYVSPSGARAASAGTYLLYASHVAAMAPATNLGAATPVQVGGSGAEPRDPTKDDPKADSKDKTPAQPGTAQPGTAMERKAVNDSVAYIRGLAELRGRNADWAEDAVRNSVSLSANAALEKKVVDVVAADIPDLLRQIDGRSVKLENVETRLATSGLVLERVQADWRTKFLAVLTNPNVAYLLMLVGVYGLLLEGYNPGAILPGVVGAISLLLALYAFQVLSVNYAGLGLMALGLALIIAEAFTPSFGALGLGGIASFVFGSVILLDTEIPGFQVARSLIGGIALAAALLMLGTTTLFARTRRRAVETGKEQMLSEYAVAMEDFEQTGFVRVHGEIWRARSAIPIKEGQRLRIVRIEDLTLEVAPHT
jgi:membrane-bound serine protease (ClpP class)